MILSYRESQLTVFHCSPTREVGILGTRESMLGRDGDSDGEEGRDGDSDGEEGRDGWMEIVMVRKGGMDGWR